MESTYLEIGLTKTLITPQTFQRFSKIYSVGSKPLTNEANVTFIPLIESLLVALKDLYCTVFNHCTIVLNYESLDTLKDWLVDLQRLLYKHHTLVFNVPYTTNVDPTILSLVRKINPAYRSSGLYEGLFTLYNPHHPLYRSVDPTIFQTLDNVVQDSLNYLSTLTDNEERFRFAMETVRKLQTREAFNEAVDFLIIALEIHPSFDVLESSRRGLTESNILRLLKIGLDWPYSQATEWSTWRFYDDLSILAWYQKDKRTAHRAYQVLIDHPNYPEHHADRIKNNGNFCILDRSYQQLVKDIQRISSSEEVKAHQSCLIGGQVPSIAHFIYIRRNDFGLVHYITIRSLRYYMPYKRIHIYNDEEPEEGKDRWWRLTLQIPGVYYYKVTKPTTINDHAVLFPQHQADIIRLVALKYMGGVYHDLDMVTLRDYRCLLSSITTAKPIGLVRESNDKLSNAWIACVPFNSFVERWIEDYETSYGNVADWWAGLSVVKPAEMAKAGSPCLVLETELFLPFNYYHTEIFKQQEVSEDFTRSYGMHLWDTEQQKRGILPLTLDEMIDKNTKYCQLVRHMIPKTDFQVTQLLERGRKVTKTMFVAVEGNIGSGKSTLLEDLKSLVFVTSHRVVLEDINNWCRYSDKEQKTLIQHYYGNPSGHSFSFQSLVLVSRLYDMYKKVEEQLQNAINTLVFFERTHLTDLLVFAKNLYDLKVMSEIEWMTYKRIHQMLTDMIQFHVDLVIYVRAEPDVCFERIQKRNRTGEEMIQLSYLEGVHQRHEDWLMNKGYYCCLDATDNVQPVKGVKQPEIFVMNGNQDMGDLSVRREQLQEVVETVDRLFMVGFEDRILDQV